MNRVKQIIDSWDPMGLLSHAPNDEYNSEINQIEELLKFTNNVNEVSNGIWKIFINAFGEENFKKSKLECKQIAYLLLSM